MKEVILLLKNNFLANYGINKFIKEKPIKKVLYILAAIYILASLMFSFGFYATTVADALEKVNLLPFMLIVFFTITSLITFMFTIHSAKDNLFGSKDNNLLFSMPLRSRTILLSRLITTIIWNLLVSLVLIIPVIIVYLSKVDVSFIFFVNILIIFLLLPIIPTILASVFGYLVAYFTSKSNKKNWMELSLLLIFTFGLYYLFYNGTNILNALVTNQQLIQNILKYGCYPIYLVGEILGGSNTYSLIMFIVINLVAFLLFIYILNIKYKSIISRLQENRTKSNYVMKSLKTLSEKKALFKKEIKRYFSSPIYVMNTGIGMLMLLMFSIGTIFFDKEQILGLMGFTDLGTVFFAVLIVIFAFVIFMTSTTSASISIEGQNFWIVKSLPINYKSLLDAKLYLNYIIVIPIVFISTIILKFSIGLTIIEAIMLFIFAIICAICEAQLGLLINLKYPKMDAQNDVIIVKRSASSMISILVPMLLIIALATIGGLLLETISINIILLVISIILIILIMIERRLLYTWGIKRITQID
jgi:ABC-2 type transport system permease protein